MASSQEEFKFGEVYEFQNRFWMLVANDKDWRFAMLESADFAESVIFVDAQYENIYYFDDVSSTKTYAGKLGEIKACGFEYWEALAGGDQETHEWEQRERDARFAEHFDPDCSRIKIPFSMLDDNYDPDLGLAAEDAMTDDEYWDEYRRIATGETSDTDNFDFDFWRNELGDIL